MRSVFTSVSARVASRFSMEVGPNLEKRIDDVQLIGNFGTLVSDTTHYTFARLDQTTLGVIVRGNFTATPTLSSAIRRAVYQQRIVFTVARDRQSAGGRIRAALQEIRRRRIPGRSQRQGVQLERGGAVGVPARLGAVLRVAAGTRAGRTGWPAASMPIETTGICFAPIRTTHF